MDKKCLGQDPNLCESYKKVTVLTCSLKLLKVSVVYHIKDFRSDPWMSSEEDGSRARMLDLSSFKYPSSI